MRKCKRLLTLVSVTALASALLAGVAMADPDGGMYQLYDVEWSDDDDYSAVATWDDDDCDYDHYQVKLVRDGNDDEYDDISTSAKHHNFASQITRTGTYTFKVRVRFDSADEGEWYESDELDVDEDFLHHLHRDYDDDDDNVGEPGTVSPGPGGSAGPGAVSSGYGWIENGSSWYYRNANGSLAANGWDAIDGHWYYFNSSGVMETGWIHDLSDGHWYYCVLAGNPYGLPEGAMLANAETPDGYYVNASGVWQ